MARHRNIRTMNIDEEYEGYDDVYGHSVEDEYAASPSMQHFLYDRSQEHHMSAYLQSDIPEEDEIEEDVKNEVDVGEQPRIPPLGELEQAQLYSCLDLLRDRMGDALTEQAGIDAILAANFDPEKALDQLLRSSVPSALKESTKLSIKGKPAPTIQDITSICTVDRVSLSQLASLHLSKKGIATEGTSPSRVAFLKPNSVTSVSHQLPSKPNLSDLAKISLGTPNYTKSTGLSNVARPSLSDLAKVNLKSSNLVNSQRFHRPILGQQVQTRDSEDSSGSLNLALALRSKCSIAEQRKIVSSENMTNVFSLFPLDNPGGPASYESLICSQASPLGRVLVADGPSSKTLFPRYKQPKLGSICPVALKPFDFTSPSPDDIIKSRLRVN